METSYNLCGQMLRLALSLKMTPSLLVANHSEDGLHLNPWQGRVAPRNWKNPAVQSLLRGTGDAPSNIIQSLRSRRSLRQWGISVAKT